MNNFDFSLEENLDKKSWSVKWTRGALTILRYFIKKEQALAFIEYMKRTEDIITSNYLTDYYQGLNYEKA